MGLPELSEIGQLEIRISIVRPTDPPSDCDFNPCDIVTLNNNPDVQQAYYVMESLNRFHTYFTGLGQAFTTSAIAAALAKDEWAETFYIDKDDKAATILKELLNLLGTIIGLVGAFAGLGPTVSICRVNM